MSASSLSIVAATTSSSTSASLPFCNKFSTNLSLESSLPTHFVRKSIPKFTLKIKTHYPSFSLLFRSLLSHRSSTFDGGQVSQDSESTESEQEEEGEEEELEEEDKTIGSEQEEEDEAIESESAEAGRLYVGNLPYSMTSSELGNVFGEAGHVVFAEIVCDRVTDRSRGFAFVTMGSVEEAKEAIKLFDGSLVGGRPVKVNFPEVPRGGERGVMGPKIRSNYRGFVDSPHKIYAGNLSWGITSQVLREAFADQPGLLSAKVIYDRDSGKSRGYGFVTFASTEQAESAVDAMNEVEVEGRPLRLKLSEQRAPLTRPPRLGRNSEDNVDSGEIFSGINIEAEKV